jgi:hypothetical protein
VACEAVANAVRHAAIGRIGVTLAADEAELTVPVEDDGRDGADPEGQGLRGIADRVAAARGRLIIHSRPGTGTVVPAVLPCESRSPTTPCSGARVWRSCSRQPASSPARSPATPKRCAKRWPGTSPDVALIDVQMPPTWTYDVWSRTVPPEETAASALCRREREVLALIAQGRHAGHTPARTHPRGFGRGRRSGP